MKVLQREREQHTWCVVPVSNILDCEEIKEINEIKVKEEIPLKLEMEGLACCKEALAYCKSEVTRALLWSYELKRAMSC